MASRMGRKRDFIDRLVGRGFAREIRPGALHRGRLYQVHHKRLYSLVGQTDNRNRRRAPLSRMVERLMLLDAVLTDGELIWLSTEADKSRYFLLRLDEYPFRAARPAPPDVRIWSEQDPPVVS